MKNILSTTFTLACLFLLFVSCSKDSDKLKTKTHPVALSVGSTNTKWHKDEIEGFVYELGQTLVVQTNDIDSGFYFVLKEEGKVNNWLSSLKGKEFMVHEDYPNTFFWTLKSSIIGIPDDLYYSEDSIGKIYISNYEDDKLSFTIEGNFIGKNNSSNKFPYLATFENIPIYKKDE